MKLQSTTVTGCGSRSCLCAGTPVVSATAMINGVALHRPDQRPDRISLLETAQGELLRQQAVKLGLLPPNTGLMAPGLTWRDRQVIRRMLDQAVPPTRPDEESCRRFFDANKHLFLRCQALHVRHILFAETPEVKVHVLLLQAEQALLELSRPGVCEERFAQLAAELSVCPTRAGGGDLGWMGPDNCDPELASELFDHKHSRWGLGVHPRLIHTRHGFHILEVLGRRKGRAAPYEEVRERIAEQLARRWRSEALTQYVGQLARGAAIEGLDRDGLGLQGAALPDFE